jgi:hypothetical protein
LMVFYRIKSATTLSVTSLCIPSSMVHLLCANTSMSTSVILIGTVMTISKLCGKLLMVLVVCMLRNLFLMLLGLLLFA